MHLRAYLRIGVTSEIGSAKGFAHNNLQINLSANVPAYATEKCCLIMITYVVCQVGTE